MNNETWVGFRDLHIQTYLTEPLVILSFILSVHTKENSLIFFLSDVRQVEWMNVFYNAY